MSSLGRGRRGHLSKKIANVKLRPAPAQHASSSRRVARDPDEEEDEVNMMNREHVKRLQDDDGAGECGHVGSSLHNRSYDQS